MTYHKPLCLQPTSEEDAEKTRVMNSVDDHVATTNHKLNDIAKQYDDITRVSAAVSLIN